MAVLLSKSGHCVQVPPHVVEREDDVAVSNEINSLSLATYSVIGVEELPAIGALHGAFLLFGANPGQEPVEDKGREYSTPGATLQVAFWLVDGIPFGVRPLAPDVVHVSVLRVKH